MVYRAGLAAGQIYGGVDGTVGKHPREAALWLRVMTIRRRRELVLAHNAAAAHSVQADLVGASRFWRTS